MMRSETAFIDALESEENVLTVLEGAGARTLANQTDWVEGSDGGPDSYNFIVVYDGAITGGSERETARDVREAVHGTAESMDVLVEPELLGHGIVSGGEYEGCIAVAVHLV